MRSKVQCIMGNGHMGSPFPVDRMTDWWADTIENITFPQLHWWAVMKCLKSCRFHIICVHTSRLIGMTPKAVVHVDADCRIISSVTQYPRTAL